MNCQQCKQPLQIDASLVDLTPSAYEMVANSVSSSTLSIRHPTPLSNRYSTPHEKLARIPGHPSVKAVWERSQAGATQRNHQHRASVAGGESFVLLQDSIIKKIPTNPPQHPRSAGNGRFPHAGPSKPRPPSTQNNHPMSPTSLKSASSMPNPSPTPLSHHLRSVDRLYKLLSSKTDLDHPLCDECTHLLLKLLTRQIEDMKKERDLYMSAEKELKKERDKEVASGATKADSERRIELLKEDERKAIAELKESEWERARLEAELQALEQEEKELEEEETEYVNIILPYICLISSTTGFGERTMLPCWLRHSNPTNCGLLELHTPPTPQHWSDWNTQMSTTTLSASVRKVQYSAPSMALDSEGLELWMGKL